jgi:hypothetical protein
MLRNFVLEIAGIQPGIHWPGRFIKRHESELLFRYTTGIDSSQKRADSAAKYTLYFELLARKIEEYDIQPENIYNMDEKGFLIGVVSKSKRIFSKRKYEQDGLNK